MPYRIGSTTTVKKLSVKLYKATCITHAETKLDTSTKQPV